MQENETSTTAECAELEGTDVIDPLQERRELWEEELELLESMLGDDLQVMSREPPLQ